MATFYVDSINGKDKPIVTTAVASNPSGTTVRITYPLGFTHDLSTGEQVVLSLFTAYINGTHTITVVDAYSFDVDGLAWTTTPDPTGTVTPVDTVAGTSWATAWKSTYGHTAAISAGDTIKFAKSPNAVSLGNALWTNLNNLLVFTSAVTKTIENCIGNTWSFSTGITGSTYTIRKIGATCQNINMSTTLTGKAAFKAITELDLSAYTKVSLWLNASNLLYFNTAGYRLCLCSDTNGDTVVNSLPLPNIYKVNTPHAVTLDFGAALGSSIKSIALYKDKAVALAVSVRLNNIFACNDFDLQTVIGKSATVGTDYYPIQAIDELNVYIDQANTTAAGKGYSGATESIETFFKKCISYPVVTTGQLISVAKNGTKSDRITITGGWNKANDLQDGETWYHGVGFDGIPIHTLNTYQTIDKICVSSYLYGIQISSVYNYISNIIAVNCANTGIYFSGGNSFENLQAMNNQTGINFFQEPGVKGKNIVANNNGITSTYAGVILSSSNCEIENVIVNNNSYGLTVIPDASYSRGYNNKIKNLTGSNNQYGTLVDKGACNQYIGCEGNVSNYGGSSINNLSVFDPTTMNLLPGMKYRNFNNVQGAFLMTGANSYLLWQTVIKQTGANGAWQLTNKTVEYLTTMPEYFRLAEIGIEINVPITLRAWVKLSELGGMARLIVRKDMCSAVIDEDIYADALQTTNWQELSIYFTPSATGVATLEITALDSPSTIYIGSISKTV